MSRADILAKVTDVLAGHGWEWTDGFDELVCDCDDFLVDGYAEPIEGLRLRNDGRDNEIAAIGFHRAHVAAVLTDALTDELAAAWSAGIEAERDFQRGGPPRVNPHSGEPHSPIDQTMLDRTGANDE